MCKNSSGLRDSARRLGSIPTERSTAVGSVNIERNEALNIFRR
jgi:hypothetical protein